MWAVGMMDSGYSIDHAPVLLLIRAVVLLAKQFADIKPRILFARIVDNAINRFNIKPFEVSLELLEFLLR